MVTGRLQAAHHRTTNMPEFTPDEYDDAVFPELRGVKPPQHDPLFADTDNFLDEEAAYWKERETEREA